MQASWRGESIYQQANCANNGAREFEFGSFDGGVDGEFSSIRLVETSDIFVALSLKRDCLTELIGYY